MSSYPGSWSAWNPDSNLPSGPDRAELPVEGWDAINNYCQARRYR